MIDMSKSTLKLIVQMIWLKKVDKAIKKYEQIKAKLNRQGAIVHALMDKYNELYPEGKVD